MSKIATKTKIEFNNQNFIVSSKSAINFVVNNSVI